MMIAVSIETSNKNKDDASSSACYSIPAEDSVPTQPTNFKKYILLI